ncbi:MULTISPECIES: phosphomannomutase/phosphoglucomutase [unclassified Sphingomonas]|uniref:phosphoglucomutase/phosphomannomutase PgmG n=1 Tax=unclassified Sphingomonas TaxID=196159 RepID=UPI00226A2AD1|nr:MULTISPECIES: phosphomannomutase/phosphoglucomutase [unclassified Sphingomonas]
MSHHFHPSILREYDIRGVTGQTLFAADAHAVGLAFAGRVRQAGGRRVAVGRDGRLSSPALEAALVDGLTAGGVDVVRIGVGPTPMLYFVEASLEVDGGIQVTGSHNPRDDNGFKMVLQHRSFFGGDIRDLAAIAAGGTAPTTTHGRVTEIDVVDAYVARLMAGHAGGVYRIGWDCGNGAAGPALEKLIELLPGEHHVLFAEVDGHFPHHHPDPAEEVNLIDLKRLVADKKLDFGVAFDGDADRIAVVDAQGRTLWGDQILALLVEPVLAATPGAPVVADVKSSDYLFARIAALGGRPIMARTGHSPMKEKMLETGAPIAGELSGHIFFGGDYYGFDDALYAAVQLIRAVHLSGRSLTDLRSAMPELVNTPDLRFPVAASRKLAVIDEVLARLRADDAAIDTTDGLRVTTADGWWLLRASNTQDLLTARAEASDAAALERLLAGLDAQLAASGISRD